MTDTPRDGGFGIYVHWPFCAAKCPYCDFNSYVAGAVDQGRWRDAFASEIARYKALVPDRLVETVYFGGGTPSLMEAETVESILSGIRAAWPVANDWEVTLEANPTSVEIDRFEGYRMAGVNRVSLGVQALNDADLARLGRRHSANEARAALTVARRVFDRVSFDLIYGRQDQSLEAWEAELNEALDLADDHLSLYQLTVEPDTGFWERHQRGALPGLPDEDLAADLYDATLAACAARGLEAYEVSNLARPGFEARHNMLYWTNGEYLGIGPGAHGRVHLDGQRHATEARKQPGDWLRAVEAREHVDRWEPLASSDQLSEYLMMGLRVRQGVSRERLADLGADLDGSFQRLADDGFLEMDGARVRTTDRGRLVLNAVLRELLV